MPLDLVLPLGRFGQRADVLHFLGIGDGMLLQVAFDDAVDEADVMGFLGADHAAAGDHFERLRHARDARQALGPAGTGEQAQA